VNCWRDSDRVGPTSSLSGVRGPDVRVLANRFGGARFGKVAFAASLGMLQNESSQRRGSRKRYRAPSSPSTGGNGPRDRGFGCDHEGTERSWWRSLKTLRSPGARHRVCWRRKAGDGRTLEREQSPWKDRARRHWKRWSMRYGLDDGAKPWSRGFDQTVCRG